ncbi:MAG: hypothetical protein ACRC45_01875, partial [Cetobacterium sp.]
TRQMMKVDFGGDNGFDTVLRYTRVNQESLVNISPKLGERLKYLTRDGSISKHDFEIAVVATYKEDESFKSHIDGMKDSFMRLGKKTSGKQATLSSESKKYLVDEHKKRAGEKTTSLYESYGYKNKPVTPKNPAGRL